MTYDELLQHHNQSSTYHMHHLHSDWAILIPVSLDKQPVPVDYHIPQVWHDLCASLQGVSPVSALRQYMVTTNGYVVSQKPEHTFLHPIIMNHTAKSYAMLGDSFIRIHEDGLTTIWEQFP